ncbi:TlpA family protein disulfide reductase [Campylobacter pinnipediorum]|uniref:TlpA family protein disulfide reductase n=1 Tax=Campylobacter pinnipediorum TaxID=1965231 RepID=UPI00084DDF8E|nr:TlpA disulfide reductase family protein [Campylobacter pinnipediorum]
MKIKNLILLISIFLFVSCGQKEDKKKNNDTNSTTVKKIKTEEKQEEKLDNNITLTTLENKTIQLMVENGKISIKNNEKATLFVFFATWCPPCKVEIPHLNNLSDKFKKELNIIGVLLENKQADEMKKFADSYRIKYDITIGSGNFLLEKAIGGVIGLPFSILYKPNGEHAITYTGLVPEEMLETDILKAIK